MSTQRVRFVEFERGEIDPETGEFPMVLATDGEASDGDILSIEGAQFTSRAPLQLSHVNDPTATLGSVSGFRRDMTSTPKKLKARGQIELTGEGAVADIRRDVAHMIRNGHVTGISVRWEPIEFQPRVSLPPEHPAHVKETERDWRKRSGMFFKKWRVLEGSVVAIQADKAAMIGRAEETEGPVSQFWRAMADQSEERDRVELEGIEPYRLYPDPPTPEPEPVRVEPEAVPEPTPEEVLESFKSATRSMLAAGLDVDTLAQVVEEHRQPSEPTVPELLETISSLRSRVEALEAGRVNGVPSTPREVGEMLRDIMAESKAEHQKNVSDLRAYVESLRGRVLDDAQREAVARIRAQLEHKLRV